MLFGLMVSIFGSIEITLDKEGLDVIKKLKSIIDSTLAEMGKIDLPDKIILHQLRSS